jgi:hypothetical protein
VRDGGPAECGAVEVMEVVWPSGAALTGGGFKPPTGALAEDRCAERRGEKARLDRVRYGSGR